MKFFQVLTTNKFQSSLDRQYVNVYNYASLAEALKTLRLYEDKDAVDGYTYTDNLGRKVVQHHLNYEENGVRKTVDLELLNQWVNESKPIVLTHQE